MIDPDKQAGVLRDAADSLNEPVNVADESRSDDRILWGIVANAGRLSNRRKQRWAHVHDATATGSSSCIELCRRFGFDPDEVVGGADDALDEPSGDSEWIPTTESLPPRGNIRYGKAYGHS